MITTTLEFNNEAAKAYTRWAETATYLHWADVIVINGDDNNDGAMLITRYEDKFVLILARYNIVQSVYDITADTVEEMVFQAARTLRATTDKMGSLSNQTIAIKRGNINLSGKTGISFDKKETIKDIGFAPTVPVLMLTTFNEVFNDPMIRNENLSIKRGKYSSSNSRRQLLKVINPMIKNLKLYFSATNYAGQESINEINLIKTREDVKKKSLSFLLQFVTFTPDDKSVTVNRDSPLFSLITPTDETVLSYTTFASLIGQAFNDVKDLLVDNGISTPTDQQIHFATLLLASGVVREGFLPGATDIDHVRPYFTVAEVIIFIKNNFSAEDAVDFFELNIPVDDLPAYLKAPDEWLEALPKVWGDRIARPAFEMLNIENKFTKKA